LAAASTVIESGSARGRCGSRRRGGSGSGRGRHRRSGSRGRRGRRCGGRRGGGRGVRHRRRGGRGCGEAGRWAKAAAVVMVVDPVRSPRRLGRRRRSHGPPAGGALGRGPRDHGGEQGAQPGGSDDAAPPDPREAGERCIAARDGLRAVCMARSHDDDLSGTPSACRKSAMRIRPESGAEVRVAPGARGFACPGSRPSCMNPFSERVVS